MMPINTRSTTKKELKELFTSVELGRGILIVVIVFCLGVYPVSVWDARLIYEAESYQGYIIKKFIDSTDKFESKILLEEYDAHYFANNDAWNKCRIGDTIIKKAGTMRFLLIRGNDTFAFYPQLFGDHEVKDN